MSDIYYTSWGYDMTIVDYLKVLENNGKTAKCVMIGCKVEDDCGKGNGRAWPVEDRVISEPFRLRVKSDHLRGSYPFCGNGSKRYDIFFKYEGMDGHYYNTWD
jgi:hypothetical protein